MRQHVDMCRIKAELFNECIDHAAAVHDKSIGAAKAEVHNPLRGVAGFPVPQVQLSVVHRNDQREFFDQWQDQIEVHVPVLKMDYIRRESI